MKFKKLLPLVYVLVCLRITAFAQDLEKSAIREIKTQFNGINKKSGLKKRVFEAEEFLESATDGGGQLTCYYKDDTVVKIIEWIGLSYGNTTREFYFNGGKLIFIYCKVCNFVQKGGGDLDYTKTMVAYEGRYYIRDNKTLKVAINEHEPASEMGKGLMDNMFADAEQYLKMTSKKK